MLQPWLPHHPREIWQKTKALRFRDKLNLQVSLLLLTDNYENKGDGNATFLPHWGRLHDCQHPRNSGCKMLTGNTRFTWEASREPPGGIWAVPEFISAKLGGRAETILYLAGLNTMQNNIARDAKPLCVLSHNISLQLSNSGLRRKFFCSHPPPSHAF